NLRLADLLAAVEALVEGGHQQAGDQQRQHRDQRHQRQQPPPACKAERAPHRHGQLRLSTDRARLSRRELTLRPRRAAAASSTWKRTRLPAMAKWMTPRVRPRAESVTTNTGASARARKASATDCRLERPRYRT